MILKDIVSVVFVGTLMKKTVMTAHVVQIFIKEVRVVYLRKKIDEIIVHVQRMFPNCGKYPKGCLPKTGCKSVPNTIDSTLHLPTQTTYTLETRKHIKPPKGFEGW